jgi:hypothetical protein
MKRVARRSLFLAAAVTSIIAFPGTAKAVTVDKTCPTTVAAGAQLQCTFSVTSASGLDIALGSFTDTTPSNTTFLGVSAAGGLLSVCPGVGTPAVGGTGTITCTVSANAFFGAAAGTQTFTITLLVNAATAAGTVISNTACYLPGGVGAGICDNTSTTVTAATPVTMRSVSARQTARGVLVRWNTASEPDTVGYNVYRVIRGKRVRLNPQMIHAQGHAAAYSFLDRTASKTPGRYFVQAISLDGRRSWYAARLLR